MKLADSGCSTKYELQMTAGRSFQRLHIKLFWEQPISKAMLSLKYYRCEEAVLVND
jgi:hypothetical protein